MTFYRWNSPHIPLINVHLPLIENEYESESCYYRPPTKFEESNVFTGVCLFTGGSHGTITHDASDLAVQGPLWTWDLSIQRPQPRPPPLHTDMGPHCTGTPSPPDSDIWSPRLDSCSNLFTWPPPPVWTSDGCGRYACYWNAFLLSFATISIAIWIFQEPCR